MRIGIIGSGSIGSTMCGLLDTVGHEVMIANSRGPESLAGLVSTTRSARAGTTAEAIGFGDPVVIAIPYGRYAELPAAELAGRTVIDTTNYDAPRDGELPELDPDAISQTELIGRHLTGSRMVKAFNTMYYKTLAGEGRPDLPRADRLTLFVAADDAEGADMAMGLVDQLGFAGVYTGSLAVGGRLQQPGSPLFNAQLRPGEVDLEGAAAS